MKLVTAREFENKVFDREGIRIVLRTDRSTPVKDFNFKRKAPACMSIKRWLKNRITSRIDDSISFVVFDPRVTETNLGLSLGSLRRAYAR